MRALKLIIAAAVLFFAWKLAGPMLKEKLRLTKGESTSDNGCVSAAQRASNAWGDGLGRFVNPPYDVDAWSRFKSSVESKISSAESECGCPAESCHRVKTAMRDLRALVGDLDNSIRSGSPPPGDAVQRQEAIDNAIDEAQVLVRAGK
ncbi:MAG TPA: hypothetical protein VN181_07415 [Thermoanaerobaculia bacterium]|nr:hypothetical protein [Thermoanaerobaculia bacterium]